MDIKILNQFQTPENFRETFYEWRNSYISILEKVIFEIESLGEDLLKADTIFQTKIYNMKKLFSS